MLLEHDEMRAKWTRGVLRMLGTEHSVAWYAHFTVRSRYRAQNLPVCWPCRSRSPAMPSGDTEAVEAVKSSGIACLQHIYLLRPLDLEGLLIRAQSLGSSRVLSRLLLHPSASRGKTCSIFILVTGQYGAR